MGAIVETPSIYVDLTAYENLKEQYKVLGIPSDDGISEILKLVGLENTGNKKALPGTRMGSAGRTGRRNKRFGDKKWGFRSVSSTGTPETKRGLPGAKGSTGRPDTCEAAACYSPTPSRVQYHRRARP